MKISTILLGAALLTATPTLAATELVSNGGFETGSISSWTLTGNTGFSSVGSFAALPVRSVTATARSARAVS